MSRAVRVEPAELEQCRYLYTVAAPKLVNIIAALNRPAPWEAAKPDIADALQNAERALAAMQRLNAKLDQYGWSA